MLFYLLAISDESDHPKIKYIYDNFHEGMMRFAAARFQSAGRENYLFDAEDAVQSAFLKITRYIDRIDFSVDKNQLQAYVFSILTNEIFNILKENSKKFEKLEEFRQKDEYNFIKELEIKENYAKIVNAIAALDEIYSTTLALVYLQEMPVKDVAKMMGISPKTVYTRLERGKKLLLNSVKGEIDYEY